MPTQNERKQNQWADAKNFLCFALGMCFFVFCFCLLFFVRFRIRELTNCICLLFRIYNVGNDGRRCRAKENECAGGRRSRFSLFYASKPLLYSYVLHTNVYNDYRVAAATTNTTAIVNKWRKCLTSYHTLPYVAGHMSSLSYLYIIFPL